MKVAIKLGGSVITYKDVNEPMAREDVIERLIYEVSKLQPPFILTHGAGSYGHPLVDKWRNCKLENSYEIHASVEKLNRIVLKYCKKFKLPVDCYSPFSTVSYSDSQFDFEKLCKKGMATLDKRHVLMTYGDIVLPEGGSKTKYNEFKVLSADTSTCLLAKAWEADKIIWVIDKDGVLSIGKPIKIIRGSNYKVNFSLTNTDVTGGLEEKLKQSQQTGIPAQVINGLVKGNLTKALYGDESIGTMVLP
jgi:isopentenyl phosphate kinase